MNLCSSSWCFLFLLSMCLMVPQPSRSLSLLDPVQIFVKRVLEVFGFGDSSSGDQSEGGGRGTHVFLSRLLSDPNLRSSSVADRCEEERSTPQCDPDSPYRTYDGSCNNLQHPAWGSVHDCLVRILPAAYEGHSGLRRAVDGGPLPTPRDLTLSVFNDVDRPTPEVTFLFTAFGQIVAHDQSLSTPPVGGDLPRDPGIKCCPVSKAESPDCSAIEVKEDDPFYSNFNITCLEFLRGLKCNSCKDTGKQHISNEVTSALDINIVYGTGKEDAMRLRTLDGTGRLKARYTKDGEFLPKNTDPNLTFCPVMKTSSCFKGGDFRINQHTYLASLHTILAREHNRMVTELKLINPHWDDEKLYQTGRRLLDAKVQSIVYGSYAPILLGEEYMRMFNLSVAKEGGAPTLYDPTLRLGTWVEHGTGTFRAHSMIPSKTGYGSVLFRDLYSNNQPILEGRMGRVLAGSCRVPSQQFDRHDVPDVTNLLYRQPNEDFGLDLPAIDIHRGRDHGLPPYVDVLKYCSSTPPDKDVGVTEFEQLAQVMPKEHVQLLKKNYGHVGDVDLYVGMQMEDRMDGAVLSATSACVVAGQFYFAKFGDRFYFEHADQAPSFTAVQRDALKKSSIARLICDNTKIKFLQKNPFLFESKDNPLIPCSEQPEVDLNLWQTSQ